MRGQGSIALSAERPENWTHADVSTARSMPWPYARTDNALYTDATRSMKVPIRNCVAHMGMQVEEWLKRIRCHEYIDHFKSRDIDGPALSGLFRCAHTQYTVLGVCIMDLQLFFVMQASAHR